MQSSNRLPFPEELQLPEGDYEAFQTGFRELTGIRLDLYKEKQMKRRIATLIRRKGMKRCGDYLMRLRSDPAELALFIDYITINVTEFFRTPDQWRFFEETVLRDLAGRCDGGLKIWSCACSTGEEVWSLAMSLSALTDLSRVRILATDLDGSVLKKAERGVFSKKSIAQLPEELRDRFFVRSGQEWAVTDELRACAEFRKLDLLTEEYPSGCDLIVCRNVLIYFTEEAKNAICTRFCGSLKPGGWLFTGNTEQIIYYKQFGLKKITGYLYQKI